jgi:hypothetical protein
VPRTASKTGIAAGEGRDRQLAGVGILELRPTGDPEGTVDVNLTGLLCRLLALPGNKGKTWAQLVAEGWISDAVTGDTRATMDIFDRTGKACPSRESAADVPPPINDQTASKVLEVLCDDGEDPASA